uniref:VPS9 domain-containing protein n=1 Tax=Steinernema glaseri TaxID=37863 RepID=A0A1I7YSB2_9BILA
MACVSRCCETIQNLIVISQPRGVANADDIIPILVYVLIQANPPALLSNMQYITGFHADRMEGEEAYCWTLFTSAIEFMKTLLHKHF